MMLFRRWLRVLCVLMAAISGAQLASAGDIPQPVLLEAEPQVAAKIQQYRQRVERERSSAEAWGRYGMVLDAHGLQAEARVAYEEASRLAPQDFRWPYYIAHTHMRTDLEASQALFKRAISLKADYPPAHVCLGQVLDMLGAADEAWMHYERAAALAPNNPWTRASFGQAALERGKLDIAARELHAAEALAPDYGTILTSLAHLYTRLGDTGKAADYGARASEHVNKILIYDPVHRAMSDEAVSLSMLRSRARMLIDESMYDEAISVYRQACGYAPADATLVGGLLDVLVRAKRYDTVLTEARAAFESGLESASIRAAHAVALCQLERYDEAEQAAEAALEAYPNLAQMFQVLGYVCAHRGDSEHAIAHLQTSLEMAPDDQDARLGLTRILIQSGRLAEALDQLDVLAPHLANDVTYLRLRGFALLGLDRHAEAVVAFEQSTALAPRDGPAVRAMASALVTLGRYAQAAKRLRDFTAAEPNAVMIQNDLAWLLATCPESSLRNGPEAVRIMERIMQSRAAHVPALLDTLAAAYAEVGRFTDAVKTLDEAITLAERTESEQSRLAGYASRRELYQAGKPYRMERQTPADSP